MKYLVAIFITVMITGCQQKTVNNGVYEKHIKIIGKDTIVNIVNEDTLVYSYFIKNNKPNGLFQSYIHGNVFSSGILIDSLKTGVWKYYNFKSSKLDSVSHFFHNKKIISLDTGNFTFKKTRMDMSGIEISIPVNWVVKENYEGTIFVISKKEKENNFKPNIALVVERNSPVDFDNYCKSAGGLLMSQFSDSRVVEEKELQLDGYQAKQIIFTGVNSNRFLGEIVLIINHPDGYYIYTAIADNGTDSAFLKYKGLFEEILYSSRIPLVKR